MILNTKYDEENGSVVGRYQLICSLRLTAESKVR